MLTDAEVRRLGQLLGRGFNERCGLKQFNNYHAILTLDSAPDIASDALFKSIDERLAALCGLPTDNIEKVRRSARSGCLLAYEITHA